MQFVFSGLELLRERFCSTQHLQQERCLLQLEGHSHLEHVLPEHLLVILPVLLQDSLAEVREVDEPILHNVVGQVNHLLLHGVQAQHLHGRM